MRPPVTRRLAVLLLGILVGLLLLKQHDRLDAGRFYDAGSRHVSVPRSSPPPRVSRADRSTGFSSIHGGYRAILRDEIVRDRRLSPELADEVAIRLLDARQEMVVELQACMQPLAAEATEILPPPCIAGLVAGSFHVWGAPAGEFPRLDVERLRGDLSAITGADLADSISENAFQDPRLLGGANRKVTLCTFRIADESGARSAERVAFFVGKDAVIVDRADFQAEYGFLPEASLSKREAIASTFTEDTIKPLPNPEDEEKGFPTNAQIEAALSAP